MLIDNHGREIRYLRLAVTDRCNLRCMYCMPEEGITYLKRDHLLTYEEMFRLVSVLSKQGISKVRITGGEPFLRKDLKGFLRQLSGISTLDSLHITTNGVLISDDINDLKEIGISSINLSLDSLDRDRFLQITRRDDFDKVMKTFNQLILHQIKTKINMVVMKDQNIEDIFSMIELTKDRDVEVRFLEEMPFNGSEEAKSKIWSHIDILQHIKSYYPQIESLPADKSSTSVTYQVPGFIGKFGIIASYSRTFCGTCDRIRITPTGDLKTCLYDGGVMNIRDIIRAGASDAEIVTAIASAISHRAKDGWEAEKNRENLITESMATIGG